MKRIIPHFPNITATASALFAVVALFASAVLLHGCSESELPGNGDDNNNLAALTIEVSDGGYAAAAGEKSGTRATENGYTTQFTDGDKIGVYAVKNGAIVAGVNNLCLVATEDGNGGIVWMTSDGKIPLYLPDATYYAYYPWQSDTDMTDKVNASATNANDFFTPLISGWTPSADQSTYSKYTAQDLMTCSGTVTQSGSALNISFSMQHQMALAVIDLPKTVYKFSNTTYGSTIPDYTVVSADFSNSEVQPCMIDDTYRCLLNPKATTQPQIVGSYADGKKKFTFTPNSITTSQYKTYQVDGGSTEPSISKDYILQVGDYLLADGSLLSKDVILTDAQKSSVAAIVFWTPAETDYTKATGRQTPASLTDDKIMTADYPNCTHGLAVAVKDISSSMQWQSTCESVEEFRKSDNFIHASKDKFVSIASGIGSTDAINRIYGYQNTQVLLAYNKYCKENSKTDYVVKPVDALASFTTSNPAPANSTGWFLPSAKELHMFYYKDVDNVYQNTGSVVTAKTINKSLNAAGYGILENWFCSSSEYAKNNDYAFTVNLHYITMIQSQKNNPFAMRSVCAF